MDRFMFTAMAYPFNYGFIPQTLEEDGDPTDVLVFSRLPVVPQSIIPCRPIGKLAMEDDAGVDSKIICVPVNKVDPDYEKFKEVTDINGSLKRRIVHFFEHYKELEPNKWVKIKDWETREAAEKDIQTAVQRYLQYQEETKSAV